MSLKNTWACAASRRIRFGALHLLHGGGPVGRIEAADRGARIEVVIAHNGFGTGSPLARWNDTLEVREQINAYRRLHDTRG